MMNPADVVKTEKAKAALANPESMPGLVVTVWCGEDVDNVDSISTVLILEIDGTANDMNITCYSEGYGIDVVHSDQLIDVLHRIELKGKVV